MEAITPSPRPSSADGDFAAVLPAVLSAAQRGQPFVACWLSRGGGAPLEFITNAAPLATPPGTSASPGGALVPLFPNGSRGVPITGDWLKHAARLAWTPCPGRRAPPLAAVSGAAGGRAAGCRGAARPV